MPMPRKTPPPMLLGEPSPSLAKLIRMNMVELTARIESLKLERQRLEAKITNLKNMTPPSPRVADLQQQTVRLHALEAAAVDLLSRKSQRKERYDQGPSSGPSSSRPGGGFRAGPGYRTGPGR